MIVITPRGRLSYPNLMAARGFNGSDENKKYSTKLIVLKSEMTDEDRESMQNLIGKLNEAASKKYGPSVKLHTVRYPPVVASEGAFVITAKNQKPPTVWGPTMVPVEGQDDGGDEIYGGRFAIMTVEPFAWSKAEGLSLGLRGVQLLEHSERIGAVDSDPAEGLRPRNLEDKVIPLPEGADGRVVAEQLYGKTDDKSDDFDLGF